MKYVECSVSTQVGLALVFEEAVKVALRAANVLDVTPKELESNSTLVDIAKE